MGRKRGRKAGPSGPRHRKGMPTVSLAQAQYRLWVGEAPKRMRGAVRFAFDDGGLPFFDRVQFESAALPEAYREDLIVYGTSDDYSGFKVYATPARYEMLLRADQRHGADDFEHEGQTYSGEQAHFHELRFDEGRRRPMQDRVIPPTLGVLMGHEDLTKAFLAHYAFDPEGLTSSMPPPPQPRTRKLSEF